jgi:hypothetical protein
MELGIYTFGEVPHDTSTGRSVGAGRRLRDLVEEMEVADRVGLDVYGVGEHHRPDYAVSAPAVVLAAAAARTERIRLTSAVNVLSSDDPVRVFQQFATLDLLSGGRAEIMAGRGSFVESFPLFGYELDAYHELFTEKLELLLALRAGERVTWSGRHRAPLTGQGVYPRPEQDPLPVWIAVGGAGLAGLVAAAEAADAGRSVLLLDQEGEQNLGGQAFWSFGGLFFVDSPEQRRLGIRDSHELAHRDWMCTAGFDRPEDHWPRRWAEAYLEFAAGEKRSWLRAQGMRFFPAVGWAERGASGPDGPGNSVPRFHVTWGTGPGVVEPFERRVRAHQGEGRIRFLFRHRVTGCSRRAGWWRACVASGWSRRWSRAGCAARGRSRASSRRGRRR